MTILQTIFNFIAQLLSARKKPSITVPITKTPPKLNPVEFGFWLKAEVAKKGQPPVGYEPTVQPRKTFCNFFVRATLKHNFNYYEFEKENTDQAGEMTDYMETHPNQWKKLECSINSALVPDYDTATKWASEGYLVIAGWKNPDYPKTTPTGHVCVIAPENTMSASGKWGRNVPLAANVGADNWYGKALSWAFKDEPNLYLFLGA